MDVLLFILILILYAYFLVLPIIGLVQVLGFIFRLFKWREMSIEYQKSMSTYGFALALYFLIILTYNLLDLKFHNEGPTILLYFLFIPTLMAIYYWTSIYKKYENA